MRSIGSPALSDVDCWDQEDIPFIYPEGLSEEGEAVLAELNEKTLIKNDETPMDIDEQPLSPTPIIPSQEHSNPLVNNPCHEKTTTASVIHSPCGLPAITLISSDGPRHSPPLYNSQLVKPSDRCCLHLIMLLPNVLQAIIHNGPFWIRHKPASWSDHQTGTVFL